MSKDDDILKQLVRLELLNNSLESLAHLSYRDNISGRDITHLLYLVSDQFRSLHSDLIGLYSPSPVSGSRSNVFSIQTDPKNPI